MRRLVFVAALAVVVPGIGWAAGPLIVNGAGTPVVWRTDPVPFNPDRGTLGALANGTAVGLVSSAFAVWAGVSTADIGFANAGALPVDVTPANVDSYVGVCGDGLSPIVFDTNGQITDEFFGPGASNDVLGFAGPECVNYGAATITEGVAVLNGKWIDGIDTASNPELPVAEFQAVFVHEFGHYVNLDHSQVNLLEAFDSDPSNDGAVATMFPYLVNGAEGGTVSLDDRVSVSMLYPAASFATGFGTIRGRVLRPDGITPFQGAYVIVRPSVEPRRNAVGMASGARYFPGNPGGPPPATLVGSYEIPGLPAGSYTVEIESIDPRFTGGSSVGPLDPPAFLPGVPEYYSGASEAGTDPPDDPAAATLVGVTSGQVRTGIDFVINGLPPPANDACPGATAITLPYQDVLDTRGATTAAGDPPQSCTFGGPNQNSSSVWYAFTATRDSIVYAHTLASDFDTVLTAYTGSCGGLTEIACNDDALGQLGSSIAFAVQTGETYLLEVTGYDITGGGQLVLSVVAGIGCEATPEPACQDGAGARLRLVNEAVDPSLDRLLWRWSGDVGPVTFGDPLALTSYAFCLYDETNGTPALRLSATLPAGGNCGSRPCWSGGDTSFRYNNPGGDGLVRVLLRRGVTGRASIMLRGRGANLGIPPLPLPPNHRVRAQLLHDDGACWEARYSAPAARNDAMQFTDRAD